MDNISIFMVVVELHMFDWSFLVVELHMFCPLRGKFGYVSTFVGIFVCLLLGVSCQRKQEELAMYNFGSLLSLKLLSPVLICIGNFHFVPLMKFLLFLYCV